MTLISKKIFALDLGTTKFCLAMLKYDSSNKMPTIKTSTVPAQGMRRGMLVDMHAAKEALMNLIDIAEQNLKVDINQVVVGIAGSHLESQINPATLSHPHPTAITPGVINKLKKQAREQGEDKNKIVIHTTPTVYKLDDYNQTPNPLGFSCNKLLCDYFIVKKAQKEYLADVVRLCNLCGIKVTRLYAEPYASASVIASSGAQKIGVAVTDIGGGTTDGMIFSEGHPKKIFTINVGGTTITNDLCIGLGISKRKQKESKPLWGFCIRTTK